MNLQRGLIFGLAAGFLWSFTFMAPKFAFQFNSTEILLGRYFIFFIVSLFFFPYSRLKELLKLDDKLLQKAFTFSLLGFTGYYFILVEAIRLMGVPFPSFTMGLVPITLILFTSDFKTNFFKFKKPIFCIFVGMLVLVSTTNQETSSENGDSIRFILGIILSFLALAAWTYYALSNSTYLARVKIDHKDWSSIIGIISFPLTLLIVGVDSVFRPQTFYLLNANNSELSTYLIMIIAIGLGSSWLATYFWNIAGSYLSKEMLGQMVVSETCFAVILNIMYEGRMPYISEILALLLLLSGVALTTKISHR